MVYYSSEISISGVITFVIILASGPCYYALNYLHQHLAGVHRNQDEESKSMIDIPSHSIPNMSLSTQQRQHHDGNNNRLSLTSNQYKFSLMAMAVSISNVWRFPYIIAANGGSAALLAYLLSTAMIASPMFLYEQIIGQYVRLSTLRCYQAIHSRWASLGWASCGFLILVASYYGMVVAYSLPYLIQSMLNPLPWTQADSPEQYWFENILNTYTESDDIDDSTDFNESKLGPVQSNLAFSLFLVWVLVFISCGFGKGVLFKVVQITIILPVVLMLILLLRSVFLQGAGEGLAFFLGRFDHTYLWSMKTWAEACGQILFSLMSGFGVVLTYSSFAAPKEDVVRTCRIIVISNVMFSIVSGLAIFSILGHIAYQEGKDVEEVAKESGAALGYITLAGAMEYFGPAANIMSVLYFFMILMLGLDSLYVWIITLATYVDDHRESVGWNRHPQWRTCGVIVVTLYLFGLIYTTRAGFQALSVVDYFMNIFLLLLVSSQSLLFNIDFGWNRMNSALHKATRGVNPDNPSGRSLQPNWLCRVDFHVLTVTFPVLFGVYLIVDSLQNTFRDYPDKLVFWFGWFLLLILSAVGISTVLRKGKSSLPVYSRDLDESRQRSEKEFSETITEENDNENSFGSSEPEDDSGSKHSYLSETATRYFLVWAVWLFAGTIFYGYAPGTNLGLGKGFYMAVNIGYSIGFGFPTESDQGAYLWFSTCYVLVGASLVAVALGFFADKIAEDADDWYINMLQKKEYKRKTDSTQKWRTRIKAWLKYHKEDVRSIGIWLGWLVLMIVYSMIRIGWSLSQAQYFAISSLSTGGHWSIPDDSPDWFFGVTGIICAIGVPIMGIAMATIGARLAASKKEKMKDMQATINQPVTPAEIKMLQRFGLEDGDGEVDEAEFIILCMCRLGTDPRIIENIGERFRHLDVDGSGALNLKEVCGKDSLDDFSTDDHHFGDVSLSELRVSEREEGDDFQDETNNDSTQKKLSSTL